MATVTAILDTCQGFLQDSGVLWDRAELLTLLQDAYRLLLSQSQGVRRMVGLPLPPRHTMTYAYPWESLHVLRGTSRKATLTHRDGRRECTYRWETEQDAGLDPIASTPGVTQLWELAHTGETVEVHYTFALPQNHERVRGLWWDHRPLQAVTTRSLDAWGFAWFMQQGEPWQYTSGLGPLKTVEVYQIRTAYVQPYQQTDLYGLLRHASGDRTYSATGDATPFSFAYTTPGEVADGWDGTGLRITTDTVTTYKALYSWEVERHAGATTFTVAGTVGTASWEAQHGATNVSALVTGLLRRATSPERQYWSQHTWEVPGGTIRAWQSSTACLLLWEVIVPDLPHLSEMGDSTPDMVPPRLHKYLGYYVLAMAFGRQGEGYQPLLAMHWEQRWRRGIRLLRRLGDVTYRDQQFQREPGRVRRNFPPTPQLPGNYPRLN